MGKPICEELSSLCSRDLIQNATIFDHYLYILSSNWQFGALKLVNDVINNTIMCTNIFGHFQYVTPYSTCTPALAPWPPSLPYIPHFAIMRSNVGPKARKFLILRCHFGHFDYFPHVFPNIYNEFCHGWHTHQKTKFWVFLGVHQKTKFWGVPPKPKWQPCGSTP